MSLGQYDRQCIVHVGLYQHLEGPSSTDIDVHSEVIKMNNMIISPNQVMSFCFYLYNITMYIGLRERFKGSVHLLHIRS